MKKNNTMKINRETAELYSVLNINNRINMKQHSGISLELILWQHKSVLISRMRKIERINMSQRPVV